MGVHDVRDYVLKMAVLEKFPRLYLELPLPIRIYTASQWHITRARGLGVMTLP